MKKGDEIVEDIPFWYCVLIAIIVVSIIRDGEIDWSTIGILIVIILLILLIRFALSLYKN